jgi:transposase
MDLGTVRAFLEADAPRVKCREHGVVVAAVPWARHGSRFTMPFEEQVAWLATEASQSTVAELMRVTWRSVGRMITRVIAEGLEREDALEGLVRIGIDEVSHRKGQKYLTVVYDHDRKRVVWAAAGRDMETVAGFFDALGPERCAKLQQVSADGASWIRTVVRERCPQAQLTLDPFHVVSWATDALDEVRRDVWNDARRSGQKALAEGLKGARFALWKNPENLTENQKLTLASVSKTNNRLYRAYLLKEQLRQVFKTGRKEEGMGILTRWLGWASRCRIPAFVGLGRTIRKHCADIATTLELGLTNAALESANTRIRLLIRRAFGFHSPEATIALVLLNLGGLCPPLPGR